MNNSLSNIKVAMWINLQKVCHYNRYLYHYHLRDGILMKPCKTYLEVGCGPGAVCGFLRAFIEYDKYTGIDIDQDRIEYAKLHYGIEPTTEFILGRIQDIDVDSFYECYLAVGLLHHLSDEECLSLLKAVLPKITDQIVIMEPVFDGNSLSAIIYRKYLERGRYKRTEAELRDVLWKAGIGAIDFHYRRRQTIGLFDFWCGVSFVS